MSSLLFADIDATSLNLFHFLDKSRKYSFVGLRNNEGLCEHEVSNNVCILEGGGVLVKIQDVLHLYLIFLPTVVSLRHLSYKDIYINGDVAGLEDLHIGSGINIRLEDMVITLGAACIPHVTIGHGTPCIHTLVVVQNVSVANLWRIRHSNDSVRVGLTVFLYQCLYLIDQLT